MLQISWNIEITFLKTVKNVIGYQAMFYPRFGYIYAIPKNHVHSSPCSYPYYIIYDKLPLQVHKVPLH